MSGDQPQVRPDGLGSEPASPAAAPPDASALPLDVSAALPEATLSAADVATTPVVSAARRRGLAAVAGVGRILRFALVIGLFAAGLVLGNQAFLNSQSAAARSAADPATVGKQPAPVVREFITAVGTNDADRIRSAVPAEPYKLFTSEIERWKFQQVTSVETLSTYEDGPRAATAFVMLGLDTNGNPIAMDLIVETQDGNIVGFK